jgi:ribosome maturation factor RimP
MTVTDCEEVSRAISPALDVDDPIDKAYHLEVSSPGIDRPLVRKSDFAAWKGHLAKVDTSILVAGRKRFRGRIEEADEAGFVVARDQPAYGEEPTARIAYDTVSEARLILTDDLIREALSKDNRARKQARRDAGETEENDETADD